MMHYESLKKTKGVILSKACSSIVLLFSRIFLLVVLHEMAKLGNRKFRSVRRKKRKGFCGHKGSNKRAKLTKEPDQTRAKKALG